MFRRISSHFFIRLVASGFQATTIVVLARLLGPSDFGLFAAITAAGGVAILLLGLGSRSHALRLLAHEKPAALANTLVMFRAIVGVLVAVMLIAVGRLFFKLDWMLLSGAAMYVAAEGVTSLAQSILLGLQYSRRAHVLALARPLVMAGGLAGGAMLDASLIGYGMSALAVATVSTSALRTADAGFYSVRATLRESLGYWSSTSLASLQQLDVPIVGAISSSHIAGVFAASSRLTNPLNLAASSILSVLTPDLSRSRDVATRRVSFLRARNLVFALSALLVFIGAPMAATVGPLLLGPDFPNAGPLFAGFFIGLGFNAASQLYASAYYAQGLMGRLARIRAISVPGGLVAIALAAMGNELSLAIGVAVARLVEFAALFLDQRRRLRW